jgi:hypothetical protein
MLDKNVEPGLPGHAVHEEGRQGFTDEVVMRRSESVLLREFPKKSEPANSQPWRQTASKQKSQGSAKLQPPNNAACLPQHRMGRSQMLQGYILIA